MFLTVATLSPFFRAKSLLVEAGEYTFPESLGTLLCCHLVQACHGLEHLHRPTYSAVQYHQGEYSQLLAVSTLRRLRSLSWCTSRDLKTWAQKPPFSQLESMGIKDSLLSSDEFRRLFAMLKSCQNIRFLAISTDSVEFEAGFARVFSRVPPSVQHLFLEFDSCHFRDASAAEFPKSPSYRISERSLVGNPRGPQV